ncbi:cyclin-dependent kinase F-4-like [Iris pallida]|uniref:Cyclin-dependent kinase F-4-like n=1 Tax=Iris pallida TaxID=29817 RepID=A0AAX6F713_IRIPA|nr:cyclin-dependent kinase F-4-like [Iris pallida]
MWAMGAIMAELFTLCPLFPGSSEVDEIRKICSVIGSPNLDSWAEGIQLAEAMKYQFPQFSSVDLATVIPSASEDAIDLISSLCSWDSNKRPTAAEVLQHSFFKPCYYMPPSLRLRATGIPSTPTSVGNKGTLEQKGARRYSTGALSNTKTASKLLPAKVLASSKTGVQRKLEMDRQEPEKSERSMKISLRQSCNSQYLPPARQKPGYLSSETSKVSSEDYSKKVAAQRMVKSSRVSEVAGKLSRMTLISGNQREQKQQQLGRSQPPASMNAGGGWQSRTDYLGRSYGIPSTRRYTRKVVG